MYTEINYSNQVELLAGKTLLLAFVSVLVEITTWLFVKL